MEGTRIYDAGWRPGDYAQILITERELAMGRFDRTYAWQGPPHWPVRIMSFCLPEKLRGDRFGGPMPERLDCFPWPLRKITDDLDFAMDGALYARTDGANALRWAYYALRARVLRITGPLRARIVMTAMVWGLAWVPQGEIPSWCHLRKRRPD